MVVIILLLSISIYVLDLDNLFIAAKGNGECIIIILRGKMNSEIYYARKIIYILYIYIRHYRKMPVTFLYEKVLKVYIRGREYGRVSAHIDYN